MATTTTPDAFIHDSYGNPALVTRRDGFWTNIIMLTGSDFGRRSSIRRQDEQPYEGNDWTARKVAELRSKGRI